MRVPIGTPWSCNAINQFLHSNCLQTMAAPVGVLPDLHENHTGVKSVEDEERQRNPRYDPPGEQPEELGLDALRDVPVRHEGVEDPEGDVGEQHEGDDLPARLGLLLSPGGADPPAGLADDHTWGGGEC